MKRIYELLMEEHLAKERQMLFLVGPRQVGKTTTSLEVSSLQSRHFYLNWDVQKDRQQIMKGPDTVAELLQLDRLSPGKAVVVFDELHKHRKWKTFIKGFFDKYSKEVQIIVTGSARLDVYKAGGDSLMGRYFLYRLHPISVAEAIRPTLREKELADHAEQLAEEDFSALFQFGGFPEPFLKRDLRFYIRWKRLRAQQLFSEDLRDLTKIQDMARIELLAQLLRAQAGQLMSYSSLANKIDVSVDTIRRWLKILKSFYYCFTLQPWSQNITRSLIKEPKTYLWDWSLVEDHGARVENFIASHLFKAVQFWTDRGLGEYDLHFLRDKEKREVDFLVSKNGRPWFLVEAKASDNGGLSKSLFHYQNLTGAEHALQVVFDLPYEAGNCFASSRPLIVPARTFLSQLV